MAVFQKNSFPKNDWPMTVWLSLDDTERFNMFLYSLADRERFWQAGKHLRADGVLPINWIHHERKTRKSEMTMKSKWSALLLRVQFRFFLNSISIFLFAHSVENQDLKRGVLIFWVKLRILESNAIASSFCWTLFLFCFQKKMKVWPRMVLAHQDCGEGRWHSQVFYQ